MKICALLFDLYNTLLQVKRVDADPEPTWQTLTRAFFPNGGSFPYAEFKSRCLQKVEESHHNARNRGVLFPEVFWPVIVQQACSDLGHLSLAEWGEFSAACMKLERTIRLSDGASEFLHQLSKEGRLLGIVSNSQPYTLTELNLALESAELGMGIFSPSLCFYSFEFGFSKPNPHVFQMLGARLSLLGVSPNEVLMVGDRWDNDLEPSRKMGWRCWHLGAPSVAGSAGSWNELQSYLNQEGQA